MKEIDIEKRNALKDKIKTLADNPKFNEYINSPEAKKHYREFSKRLDKIIEENLKLMPEMKDEINQS